MTVLHFTFIFRSTRVLTSWTWGKIYKGHRTLNFSEVGGMRYHMPVTHNVFEHTRQVHDMEGTTKAVILLDHVMHTNIRFHEKTDLVKTYIPTMHTTLHAH